MSESLPVQSLIEGIFNSIESFIQKNVAQYPYTESYRVLIKAKTCLKHPRYMLMTSIWRTNSLERSDCGTAQAKKQKQKNRPAGAPCVVLSKEQNIYLQSNILHPHSPREPCFRYPYSIGVHALPRAPPYHYLTTPNHFQGTSFQPPAIGDPRPLDGSQEVV